MAAVWRRWAQVEGAAVEEATAAAMKRQGVGGQGRLGSEGAGGWVTGREGEGEGWGGAEATVRGVLPRVHRR